MRTNQINTINKGLENIAVAESAITYIDTKNNKIYHYGYNLNDIINTICFEEMTFLLWYGYFPNKKQLNKLRYEIIKNMFLPEEIINILKMLPANTSPIRALQIAVSILSLYDKDADNITLKANIQKAKKIIGQIITIISNFYRIKENKRLIKPDFSLSVAANFLYMFHGKKPDEKDLIVADRLMSLYADHELNASTFAARVTSSTLSDIYSAVISAISCLKGPLHGGAMEKVIKMLYEIKTKKAIKPYIDRLLNNKKRVMGFGHRIYKKEDPRTKHLHEYAKMICIKNGKRRLHDLSICLEKYVYKRKQIYPNIEFYSAIIQNAMNIPPEYFSSFFAMSRTVGWIAHIMEQYKNNRLIRPILRYTGQLNKLFIPIEKRA